MLLGPHNITLFLGNYGSGKTEVSVNFAMHLACEKLTETVVLADLDLVNPYFRSREARDVMAKQGIRVVIPEQKYMHADLPILVPGVRAELKAAPGAACGRMHVILDVGGDNAGARVLGALKDALPEGGFRALMVLNASRPFTSDVEGILRMKSEIERAGDLKVTGFVSNTHMMQDTDAAIVLGGRQLAGRAALACGLPLEFVCVPQDMVESVAGEIVEDILPVRRYLSTPWKEQGEAREQLCRILSGL